MPFRSWDHREHITVKSFPSLVFNDFSITLVLFVRNCVTGVYIGKRAPPAGPSVWRIAGRGIESCVLTCRDDQVPALRRSGLLSALRPRPELRPLDGDYAAGHRRHQ